MQALTTYKQKHSAPIQTARGFAFGACEDNETKEPISVPPHRKIVLASMLSYGRFKMKYFIQRDEEKVARKLANIMRIILSSFETRRKVLLLWSTLMETQWENR